MTIVPVNTPLLGTLEAQYVQDCIDTGWISSEGPFVERFEEAFSKVVDRKYGVAVANGSAALDIAVQALELGAGHEVIMPTFTIISPALSLVRAGVTPVFIDAEPHTWNMNCNQIEEKITARTRAILVVHIYGLPVDMNPVLEIAHRHGLYVIEDAAEMHGQTYYGKPCGSFGHISTFSFYPNKLITTGEGGMVVTNDESLAARCRKLRNLCFEPGGRRFVHYEMGWNYRLTNVQAALGLAQLQKIEEHLSIKKRMGALYRERLKGLQDFAQPVASMPYADNVYWVYGLVAKSEELAQQTITLLAAEGVATRPFFWCMHEQPVFKSMCWFVKESFPVAEAIARAGFYLPSGVGLKRAEQEQVIEVMLSAHG